MYEGENKRGRGRVREEGDSTEGSRGGRVRWRPRGAERFPRFNEGKREPGGGAKVILIERFGT